MSRTRSAAAALVAALAVCWPHLAGAQETELARALRAGGKPLTSPELRALLGTAARDAVAGPGVEMALLSPGVGVLTPGEMPGSGPDLSRTRRAASFARHPRSHQLAQAPAPVATETELEKNLKAGAVPLTGDQLRALQVGNTYYWTTPSGVRGVFYTSPDGRFAFKPVTGPNAGQLRQGTWQITGNQFWMRRTTGDQSILLTAKQADGSYRHFRPNSGEISDIVTEWKPGNPETLPLP